MSYHADDTICAIATAAGGAARGMVRVSGYDAVEIVERCFQPKECGALGASMNPRAITGSFRVVFDEHRSEANASTAVPYEGGETNPPLAPPYEGGEFMLPCDLFLWPTNRSYTREPVAELHTFGSPPLLQSVVEALCRAGARLAEPGEFTLRAFLVGRLDLTQAEAVLGVIDAHNANELDAALAQLAGGLARPLHELREQLLQLLAELEAGLDFVEEDIQFVSREELRSRIDAGSALLADVAAQMESRHVARDLRRIALVGPPNVGKSSLFNALVARYGDVDSSSRNRTAAALVSPQSGTTRDYLTGTISLDGLSCELVDTAGVGDFPDRSGPVSAIEVTAKSRAVQQRSRAAIRAYCVEAGDLVAEGEQAVCPEVDSDDCDIVVITKVDLAPDSIAENYLVGKTPIVVTSSHTGAGLAEFRDACQKLLSREATHRGFVVGATADRCRESVRLAESALQAARNTIDAGEGDELVAIELRAALAELGKVVGVVYTDDLLDRIFKSFCIGK